MKKYYFILLVVILQGCVTSQKKCKRLYNEACSQQFDVIVVPGVPYEDGSWDVVMRGRVYWSKFLYDRGITKNIMFSGGSVYTPYYESRIMALYAQAIGVPDSVIYTEIRAEHSTENIYYSYKKAKNLGFEKVALATDPFQSGMLRRFIDKCVDESIASIPFIVDTLQVIDTANLEHITIVDSLAYNPDFVSIKERESFFKRLMGTRGKNLNESYYSDGKLEDD